MKIALHIQNWKKTPSPILIPFKGKKFDPKQITAMNTPINPKAISFIFSMLKRTKALLQQGLGRPELSVG